MIRCPNCHVENRSGARYCKACGTALPPGPAVSMSLAASSPTADTSPAGNPGAATRPLDPAAEVTLSEQVTEETQPTLTIETRTARHGSDTRPLQLKPGFTRRPAGAIFGDRFLLEQLVFSDERHCQYLVSQLGASDGQAIVACPNPACGAVYGPQPGGAGQFCIDCGTPLSGSSPELVLVESPALLFPEAAGLARRGLPHGSVRAPVAYFTERVAGGIRHCAVLPRVAPFSSTTGQRPTRVQALQWGADLARGLDTLHQNGVSFGGQVNEARLGLAAPGVPAGGKPVWANFSGSRLQPEAAGQPDPADIQALGRLVYFWLTGKTHYERSSLPAAWAPVFEAVFTPPGYGSGSELARAIEELPTGEPAQPVEMRFGRRTHVGRERTLNEDSLLTLEANRIQQSAGQPLGLFAVADGMGGHSAGEVASGALVNDLYARAVSELFSIQPSAQPAQDRAGWLHAAVGHANLAVYEMRRSAGTDMGSTLVAALVDGSQAHIAHVGDSRAYIVNAQGIRQVTTDHSLVQRLVATGQITREEARHHPQRNVIYRTMGDKPQVEVDTVTLPLATGDRLLLCSDGLSGMVDDPTIQRIVMEAASPQAACDALVQAANDNGGEDNISVIVVEIMPA